MFEFTSLVSEKRSNDESRSAYIHYRTPSPQRLRHCGRGGREKGCRYMHVPMCFVHAYIHVQVVYC